MPDAEEPEVQELDGPDPRTWQGNHELWGLIQDLEALDHVSELMDGRTAQDGMSPAYEEARRFLRSAGYACREQLSLMLLSMYGIKPEGSGASPFAAAGKPRAFGADTSPPPATLSRWQASRQSDGSACAR